MSGALSPDAARLRSLRESLAAISPGRWARAHDGGHFIECQGEMGELFVLARFDAGASVDEVIFVADAPDNVRFLLRLLDRAFGEIRALRGGVRSAPAPKDFAAECAMKCKEPAFKAFLEKQCGLERPLTDERVAQKVRTLLGVSSRGELNDGGRAGAAWQDLRGRFDAWLRAERSGT